MRDASGGSSTKRLMTLVACVALVLFALVAEPEDEFTLGLGAVIVAGATAALAIVMLVSRAKELRGSHARVRGMGWAYLGLRCIVAATALISASLLAFITLYELNDRLRTNRSHDRLEIHPWGLGLGIVAALLTAGRLKEFLTVSERRPRRLRRLWPVGAVALIATGILSFDLHERWTFSRMMADFHADAAKSAADPEAASQHDWLKQEYERRWMRPWLPLHPEPAPRSALRH